MRRRIHVGYVEDWGWFYPAGFGLTWCAGSRTPTCLASCTSTCALLWTSGRTKLRLILYLNLRPETILNQLLKTVFYFYSLYIPLLCSLSLLPFFILTLIKEYINKTWFLNGTFSRINFTYGSFFRRGQIKCKQTC